VSCEQTRLLIGAEPDVTTPALLEHLKSCPECSRFRDQVRAFEVKIRRAMEQPPLGSAAAVPRPAARRQVPWRQWALAASVAFAMFAALLVWVLRPSETLAREVVAHVESEPQSLLATRHVTAADIAEVLRHSGVELEVASDRITFASSCWFRGHYVPHLVVQTTRGPVTVMILRYEHVGSRQRFHEAGMSGVIVPGAAGSMAVLARGGGSVDGLVQDVEHDVRWLPHEHN
jgi:uncharacterized protein DUF3379